jgi:hypothetical protein
VPTAAQYAARLAQGVCPRCAKRKLVRGMRVCVVCWPKLSEADRAWKKANPERDRATRRRYYAKRKDDRARCLGCSKRIEKFRRCFRCRMAMAEAAKRYRKRQGPRPRKLRPRPRIDARAAVALREAGLRWVEIAHHLGCSVAGAFLAARRAANISP